MTRDQLIKIVSSITYFPHPEYSRGNLILHDDIFLNPKEVTTHISGASSFDMTGDIEIGNWVMIGHGVQIYTHNHYHHGREILIQKQKRDGIIISGLKIGNDVWIHESIILAQVTEIPDGVVIGAGSVLTKNPGSYEIWAGNPARKIGTR